MLTERRNNERHHVRTRRQDVWFTFKSQDRADRLADGYGPLETLMEARLPASATVPSHHQQQVGEVVTYVREGSLAWEDSIGNSGVIHAGQFRRSTEAQGVRYTETNASRVDSAHVFQVRLRASNVNPRAAHEHRRFFTAERRGSMCVIASPDGRRGSLRLHRDICVYSALPFCGQHMAHELAPGRSAWLHVVQGEVMVDGIVLTTGDAVGLTGPRRVSLTGKEESEILLVDVTS